MIHTLKVTFLFAQSQNRHVFKRPINNDFELIKHKHSDKQDFKQHLKQLLKISFILYYPYI